jgi:isopenicillin N synthase-like dioxygenase
MWSEGSSSAAGEAVSEKQTGTGSDEGKWLWVRPQPNCAIINLGDAASKFSNGVLRSGRHRVVPAPGEQGLWPRYSVVYFVRPNDDCVLRTLEGSGIPARGNRGGKNAGDVDEDEEITAKEWIFRQAERLRTGKR